MLSARRRIQDPVEVPYMRKLLVGVLASVVLSLPHSAMAQGAIAGIVKDSSGAVLPGVTVEAGSPALIEKVRSVVTDTAGQYQVVDLRPGSYTVTFTLPGFRTVRREGVELSGAFTAADRSTAALPTSASA